MCYVRYMFTSRTQYLSLHLTQQTWTYKSKMVSLNLLSMINSKWVHTLHVPIKNGLSLTYCKNGIFECYIMCLFKKL